MPFVVFMIRDFDFSEDSVGLYAGLLTAMFALCQFFSSYIWGLFSDRSGRKLSLLLGSLFSAFAIIVFGTSTTYAQALAARAIAGIFNGNIGVARAYIADITNGKNRAFAFSVLAIAFSAGMVFGSTCGGALIHTYDIREDGTHRLSEGVLEWWIFHTRFPYLLPCVIGSFISLFSLALTYVYIQDKDRSKATTRTTNPKDRNVRNYTADTNNAEDAERSRSLPMVSMGSMGATSSSSSLKSNKQANASSNSLPHFEDLLQVEMAASIVEASTMGTNALHEGMKAFQSNYQGERSKLLEMDEFNDPEKSDENAMMLNLRIGSLGELFAKTPIIHGLVVNATIMVLLITWNAVVPLLLVQILEMDSLATGIYMAYNGLVLFGFTWFIQPALMKRFKYKRLYIAFGTAQIAVILLFPSITKIPHITEWSIVSLTALTSFVGAFKFAFCTNLFILSLVFINNSVPQTAMGRANGLGQSIGAGLRGLGPLIGGALWSWSMTMEEKWWAIYVAYMFMFIPTAYSVFHCWWFIQNDIGKTWKERYSVEKK